MQRILFLAALLALAGPEAIACQCAPPPDVKTAYAGSLNVFVGTVVDISDPVTPFTRARVWTRMKYSEVTGQELAQSIKPRDYGFRVTFRVAESFKTPLPETVTFISGRGGGDCGFPVEVGGTYLVYLDPSPNRWYDFHSCSRTAQIESTAGDLAALHGLSKSYAPVPVPPTPGSHGPWRIITIVIFVLAGGVSIIVKSRQRKAGT